MNKLICFVTILLCIFGYIQADKEAPIVKTDAGELKGKVQISRGGRDYDAFLGIPYAVIPERFENSVPVPAWEGVKDATEFGPICAQQSLATGQAQGEEDCLYLNVYTPKADSKKRPVIVYIHGGGFTFGTGFVYGGRILMDKEVVLVTINYRLNILGFLNTRDGLVTGNMGLKDQVMALKWVQKNIAAFGGDPDRVTIDGQSAGGASVMHLVISPLAKGLFHNAIPQSGSVLNPWAFKENTVENAIRVGKKLDCNTESLTDLVACLKDKPVKQLVEAQTMNKWHMDPLVPFPPSLEIKSERNPDPFLDRTPAQILESGEFSKVPILLTMTKDEGLLLHSSVVLRNEPLLKDLNENWNRVAPTTFYYEDEPGLKSHLKQVTKELHQFYFGNDKITMKKQENLTNLYTDSCFLSGIHRAALKLAKSTPVYMGLFTRASKGFSTTKMFGINEILGVSHGDELSYVYNPVAPDPTLLLLYDLTLEEDVQYSKELVKLVMSFVESGVPKLPAASTPTSWTPITKEEIQTGDLNWMNLGDETDLLKSPFKNRTALWEKLYQYNKDEL